MFAALSLIRLRMPAAAAAAATAAAGALALGVPAAAAAHACAGADSNPNASSLKVVKRATVCLLNKRRHAHGLGSFHDNGDLDHASGGHARDMAANHYFAHGDFVGRIRAAGYLSGAGSWFVGENIAWGSGSYATPAGIVRLWMNSPPHRHNILSSGFRQIGIGIARGTPRAGLSDGATYTTDFGTRG